MREALNLQNLLKCSVLDVSRAMWTILYYSSFAYNACTSKLYKNCRIFVNEKRGATYSTGINLKGQEKNSETFYSRTNTEWIKIFHEYITWSMFIFVKKCRIEFQVCLNLWKIYVNIKCCNRYTCVLNLVECKEERLWLGFVTFTLVSALFHFEVITKRMSLKYM